MDKLNFAFFGTDKFARIILEELKSRGLTPSLIVTVPDKAKGRGLAVSSPETKIWAEKENIPCYQPVSLKHSFDELSKSDFDLFIVASYRKLIPNDILNIPKYKTINVHPSLLPKLRGPSPIVTSILAEDETGVTIIELDEELDHGPILIQRKASVSEWPPYYSELEETLAKLSGELLLEIIPKILNGEVRLIDQDHDKATLTKIIKKEDGLIDLSENPEINLRKIRAYQNWPSAYYFDEDGKRIIIKKAKIEDGKLVLERIIPDGKKEMNYSDYLRGKN